MKARDPYIDNLKGALVLLVVLGHAIEPFMQHSAVAGIYAAIYLFHMPAFVLLAGATSKRSVSLRAMAKLAAFLAGAHLLYQVPGWALHGSPIALLRPYWHLWFLLSLIIWRISAPVWRVGVVAVPVAFTIGLVSGMFPVGYPLSLSRTLVFLPFFVVGLCYGREIIRVFSLNRWPAISVSVLGFGVFLPLWPDVNAWLYGSYNFHDLNVGAGVGIAVRLLHYVLACAATALFFNAVPRSKGWLTATGRNALWIYLFHPLGLKVLKLLYAFGH